MHIEKENNTIDFYFVSQDLIRDLSLYSKVSFANSQYALSQSMKIAAKPQAKVQNRRPSLLMMYTEI